MTNVVLLLLLCILSASCAGTPPLAERAAPGTRTFTWIAPTGKVAGLQAGDPTAPRVILVHGTPGSASDWGSFLADPPAGLELIALDRPGFGDSEPRRAVPALADQAAALEPLLVQRDGRWPVLVGHSLGGPIVVRAAIDFPDRVGGLVVLAGNLDPGLEDLHWYNYAGRVVSLLLPRAMRNSNHELWPQREELEALAPHLSEVRCPVLIVHGTDDSLVPFANADYLEQALTGAPSVDRWTLDGVDHFFVWTHPGVVRAAIEAMAARVAGTRHGPLSPPPAPAR